MNWITEEPFPLDYLQSQRWYVEMATPRDDPGSHSTEPAKSINALRGCGGCPVECLEGQELSRGSLHGRRGRQWDNPNLGHALDPCPWSLRTFPEHPLLPSIRPFPWSLRNVPTCEGKTTLPVVSSLTAVTSTSTGRCRETHTRTPFAAPLSAKARISVRSGSSVECLHGIFHCV